MKGSFQGSVGNPGTEAILSLIVPGAGQIYNGTFWRGVFWLIITPGFRSGSAGLFGWPFHLIVAYTAYNYAEKQLLR